MEFLYVDFLYIFKSSFVNEEEEMEEANVKANKLKLQKLKTMHES